MATLTAKQVESFESGVYVLFHELYRSADS